MVFSNGIGHVLDGNLGTGHEYKYYKTERLRHWCLRGARLKHLLLNLFIVPLALCWAATSQAYPAYSQNPATSSGYCADCHGDFDGGNYSSLTTDDPADWGMNLMSGHVSRYGMQCTDCHDNVAQAPVATNSSISGITCATCHGRDEDITPNDGAFGGSAAGRGDGLRARHAQAGITVCSNCHTADTTPVGENVAPATYVAKGIDPCDENAYGSITFGSAGLDNDGDGLRDGDDPDCGASTNNPPIVTDDFAVTQQDTQITIDVLVNDSDPDGNGISINSYDSTSAFGGSVVCDTTGGMCTYTPALGFTGDDTFTYDITDGMAVSANRATVTVTVEAPVNQPPSCSGITPTTGQVGTAINFSANASDPNGDTLSYSWDFGDGSSSSLPSPSHTYSSAGDYTVSLMVDDSNGGTATCMATVTVSVTPPVNQNPTCSGITPTMGEQGAAITFTANASDPDGDPLTYNWDFGDGSTSTQASPSHIYTNTGDYNVTLTVNDGRGGSSSCSATVSISAPPPENQPPVCSNITPTTGNTNVALSFSADAIDPDGDSLTYNWDFGDGTTSTQASPSHAYNSAGTYTVSLTVSDGNGGASSCSTGVTITAPSPASGQVLYNQNCAFCHGDPADPGGMGPVAFTVPGAASCSIKGAIFNPEPWNVPQMTSMFSGGGLTDSQIDSIAGYLSTFNTGEQLYNSMCARCHGPGGNGQGLAHEAVRGESAGDIAEAIQEEQVMRFLSCLPTNRPDALDKIADYLGGQQRREGGGEMEDAGDEHQGGKDGWQHYTSHRHQERRAGYHGREYDGERHD